MWLMVGMAWQARLVVCHFDTDLCAAICVMCGLPSVLGWCLVLPSLFVRGWC